MSTGILAQGTVIKMGAAANALAAIGGITNFNTPSSSRTVIDNTDLGSTDKEFLLGLRDNGEMSIDLNYNPEAHDDLDDAYEAGDLMYWAIVYRDGSSRTFAGFITSFGQEGSIDSLLTGKMTIKVSGAVTRVAAV